MYTQISLIRSRVQLLRNISIGTSRVLPLLAAVCAREFQFTFGAFFSKFSCSIKLVMDAPLTKPPNVLVYTGENFSSGEPALYRNIAKHLNSTLRADSYTVYLLTPSQVQNDPWEENSTLLVLSCDTLEEDIADKFKKYVTDGGKILNFGCKIDGPDHGILFKEQNERAIVSINYKGTETRLRPCKNAIECSQPQTTLAMDANEKPRIITMETGSGIVVASDVHLELDGDVVENDKALLDVLNESNDARMDILRDLLSVHLNISCSEVQGDLKLTVGYLLTKQNLTTSFLKNCHQASFKKMEIKLVDCNKMQTSPEVKERELPVLYNYPEDECSTFNKEEYFSHLTTTSMGQMLCFVDVIGTTMDVIECLSDVEGAVVASHRQIRGKGRRGNRWISPEGCVAFSVHFSLSLQSPLGKRMSVIQYFAVLSLVKAIRETPGYENLDLQVKWPNDIYYERRSKLGGVIVNSTIQGDTVHVYTGSGLNVSNPKPTLSVNEVIRLHNLKTGGHLPPFTRERLIAISLNELEKLVVNFQKKNVDYFLSSYYKYWMHMGQQVTLQNNTGPATIVGIDDYGFLVVETENKRKIALQPDGNSFDIMKNLIVLREM